MTLIELLVVFSIIIILGALINSAIQGARSAARKAQCLANIRALGQAALLYAQNDREGKFPFAGAGPDTSGDGMAFGLLYDPVNFSDLSVFSCPELLRKSLPSKPTGTPYSIQASLNSYRFILDETKLTSQTMSHPTGNIILIENYISGKTPVSSGYNHGSSGLTVFFMNGKCKFIGQGNTKIDPNYDKLGTTAYPSASPAIADWDSYLKS